MSGSPRGQAYRMAAARSTNLAQQRYLNARAERLAGEPPPAGDPRGPVLITLSRPAVRITG